MRRLNTASGLLFSLLVLLSALQIGCKGPSEMTVVGGPEMNSGGNAAVVRVYQLASDASFQRSTVETFWRDDEGALGAELLAPKQEFVVYPGDRRSFTLELLKDTKFVGVAADLRNPDPNQWRVLYPARELKGKDITVTVEDNRLAVSTE